MIAVDIEPALLNDEVGSGFPAVITFKAHAPGSTVVYVTSWGDGARSRGTTGGENRLQHVYDFPGTYSPVVQLITADDAASFQLSITVLPKREREAALHRWSGPSLNLADLGSYFSSVEDSPSPILLNLARAVAAGANQILLPTGVIVEPRSNVQIVEGHKLVSGGSVLTSDAVPAGTLLSLDFSMNDDYTEAAQVQIVGRAIGYGGVTERAVTPEAGLKGSYDDELVKDSIGFLLATTPGERVMKPTFGTRLRELVHDMADPVTAYLGQAYVADAVAEFERRATLLRPTVSIEGHDIRIKADLVFTTGDSQVFDQSISLNADTER